MKNNLEKTAFGFILFLSFAANAEKSEKQIREAIRYVVSQRHPEVSDSFWNDLGPEAVPVLKKMYEESTTTQERSLIIEGLAHSQETSTGEFLRSAVGSTANDVLKRKLLNAVIRSEGERSFEFVESYLKSSDSHVRLTVAKGLMAYNSNEKIKKRLEEFQAEEKRPWVVAELNKKDQLQKPLKIDKSKKAQVEPIPQKPVEALPEKNWSGLWRGSYVTENKMVLVDATLTLIDSTKSPMSWKVEMKLPKQPKTEWKQGEFSLHYFQTNRAHWIEIRNQRLDAVFVAQRKVKQ
jgi:hypothetical protein